jgi:hypothetical protein
MNDDLVDLNLVAGTNISLSRVGETVVVDCTYDDSTILADIEAIQTEIGGIGEALDKINGEEVGD